VRITAGNVEFGFSPFTIRRVAIEPKGIILSARRVAIEPKGITVFALSLQATNSAG
jgi:hypothetical protein